jgi:beta-aspartyl-peptidase (threonine type)
LRALCLTPDGRHGGAAGQAGSTYNVMTSTSADVEVRARVEL